MPQSKFVYNKKNLFVYKISILPQGRKKHTILFGVGNLAPTKSQIRVQVEKVFNASIASATNSDEKRAFVYELTDLLHAVNCNNYSIETYVENGTIVSGVKKK